METQATNHSNIRQIALGTSIALTLAIAVATTALAILFPYPLIIGASGGGLALAIAATGGIGYALTGRVAKVPQDVTLDTLSEKQIAQLINAYKAHQELFLKQKNIADAIKIALNLGDVYTQQRNNKLAINSYTQATELAIHDLNSYSSSNYERSKDCIIKKEVIKLYLSKAAIIQYLEKAWHKLAVAYEKDKDLNATLTYYENLIALYETLISANYAEKAHRKSLAQIYFNAATIALTQKDTDTAYKYYTASGRQYSIMEDQEAKINVHKKAIEAWLQQIDLELNRDQASTPKELLDTLGQLWYDAAGSYKVYNLYAESLFACIKTIEIYNILLLNKIEIGHLASLKNLEFFPNLLVWPHQTHSLVLDTTFPEHPENWFNLNCLIGALKLAKDNYQSIYQYLKHASSISICPPIPRNLTDSNYVVTEFTVVCKELINLYHLILQLPLINDGTKKSTILSLSLLWDDLITMHVNPIDRNASMELKTFKAFTKLVGEANNFFNSISKEDASYEKVRRIFYELHKKILQENQSKYRLIQLEPDSDKSANIKYALSMQMGESNILLGHYCEAINYFFDSSNYRVTTEEQKSALLKAQECLFQAIKDERYSDQRQDLHKKLGDCYLNISKIQTDNKEKIGSLILAGESYFEAYKTIPLTSLLSEEQKSLLATSLAFYRHAFFLAETSTADTSHTQINGFIKHINSQIIRINSILLDTKDFTSRTTANLRTFDHSPPRRVGSQGLLPITTPTLRRSQSQDLSPSSSFNAQRAGTSRRIQSPTEDPSSTAHSSMRRALFPLQGNTTEPERPQPKKSFLKRLFGK